MTIPQTLSAAFAGDYDLEREIARDGICTDYLAARRERNVPVVLHILKAELPPDARFRVLRNVPLFEGWQHPNVESVLESGSRGSFDYYVTSHCAGVRLRDRLYRNGGLAVSEAMRIACDVAEGLDAIHARKMVHRSITPDTVWLAADRAIIMLDVAHVVGVSAGNTERLIGNTCYLAPEQVDSRPFGPASDVYGLGVLLYEMLTGRSAFDGPTVDMLLSIMQAERPRPSAVRPVPPEIDEIVTKAMAIEHDKRYRSAREMAEALSGVPIKVERL